MLTCRAPRCLPRKEFPSCLHPGLQEPRYAWTMVSRRASSLVLDMPVLHMRTGHAGASGRSTRVTSDGASFQRILLERHPCLHPIARCPRSRVVVPGLVPDPLGPPDIVPDVGGDADGLLLLDTGSGHRLLVAGRKNRTATACRRRRPRPERVLRVSPSLR